MTRSMGRLVLDIVEEYPYFLFGISASTRDYRLCWNLNKALGVALKRMPHVELFRKGGDRAEHSLYTFYSEAELAKYRLIENRSGNSLLLPDAPKADFLLMIDQSPAIDPEKILQVIRSIRSVLLAFEIEIDNLKTKQNLLLTT